MKRLLARSHWAQIWEAALGLVLVAILAWALFDSFQAVERRSLAAIARAEHRALATTLQVYRLRHGQWPANLQELAQANDQELALGGESVHRDRLFTEDGRMLDPYGNPYRYHPRTGRLELPVPIQSRSSPN